MDAFEFCKEFGRMCKTYEYCDDCPMEKWERKTNLSCRDILLSDEHIRERIEIVEKWSKEHPRKTMMQDFFEKFPNAPRNDMGTPRLCPSDCGYEKVSCCPGDVVCDSPKCWNRPLEE